MAERPAVIHGLLGLKNKEALMKSTRAKSETVSMGEIVEGLRHMPKAKLRIVHDVVKALAKSTAKSKRESNREGLKRRNLLDTPFCGIWEDRADIGNGQSYARMVRLMLETRSDRRKNIR